MNVNTRNLAIITLYASLYAMLVIFLPGLSYGPLQVRLADALLAIVPLLGLAGVFGHTLGVFVANLFSPAGPIDLLNTIPSFMMAFIVYYVYTKTNNDFTVIASCTAYSTVLGITVGWMLSFLYGYPLLITIAYVILGNFIASVLLGWPLFKFLKRTGVLHKWLPK
ncbi:MAG: QueT transporter family protein [Candidatus Bathyarchaeota archaeon]|nr:QueT transporter family protein [Candidatus Bathyarchaeota archaeon]MDD4325092.1 QueT transporter family protein [Candidatus Bathyarchaeota archaeon]MDI9576789.1 QueT transporter family protein [Thermoproteota archaeon]NLD66951.1 QueT transporter family protein [Thermoproteota archaeon]